jgi:ribulose-5-phosphate 4-epimerase/fuculose-1-phosphate aldolase
MTEEQARRELPAYGRSLFARGYSCGTSGNLSVRLDDGTFLMSPTNVSLGLLESANLSRLDAEGHHTAGPPPTKESWLHLAMYASRPQDAAVVHLH